MFRPWQRSHQIEWEAQPSEIPHTLGGRPQYGVCGLGMLASFSTFAFGLLEEAPDVREVLGEFKGC